MENISPTIQLDILVKLAVKKRNLLGSSYNLEGVVSYKNIFQEFHGIFSYPMRKFLHLVMTLLNTILIHGLMSNQCAKSETYSHLNCSFG